MQGQEASRLLLYDKTYDGTKATYGKNVEILNVKSHNAYS